MSELTCPSDKCGSPNLPNAQFCSRCGSELDNADSVYEKELRTVIADFRAVLMRHRPGSKLLKKLDGSAFNTQDDLMTALMKAVSAAIPVCDDTRDIWESVFESAAKHAVAECRRDRVKEGRQKADYELETEILRMKKWRAAIDEDEDEDDWRCDVMNELVFDLERFRDAPI